MTHMTKTLIAGHFMHSYMFVSDKASFTNDTTPNHWINNEQAHDPKFSKPLFLWNYCELAVKH